MILKKSCPGTKLDLNFSDIQQAILKIATKTQRHKEIKYMNFTPLSEKEECIVRKIVDAAYAVHKTLGPGLLEKVYEVCFCHELTKRNLKNQRQVNIPIVYDRIVFNEGLRLDVLMVLKE